MRYVVHKLLTVKALSLILLDIVAVTGSTVAAIWARLGTPAAYSLSAEGYLYNILFIIFVHMVVLYYHDLYELKATGAKKRLYVEVAQSVAIASALLFGTYYLAPALSVGRGVFLINMVLLPQLLTLTRLIYLWMGRKGALVQRVVLLGEADEIQDVWHRLEDSENYRVEGCILSGDAGEAELPRLLGPMDDLKRIIIEQRIDCVIVAMRERRGKLPLQDLLYLKLAGVEVENQATFVERVTGRVPVAGLPPSSLVFSDGFKRITVYQRLKFVPDVMLAMVLLVLLSPLLLVMALAVRLESPGQALYRQRRVGMAGEEFNIYKFRTMRQNAEEEGAQFAQQDDPRVTRMGRVLRKIRVDELPQLLNVVRGEMAFVGPRPERPEFVAGLQEKIPYYYLRTIIRPGITGWAQVRYPYGSTLTQHREKLEHDLYYIKNISLTMDILIALETIRVVLLGRGGR